jgi:hypothetical protein
MTKLKSLLAALAAAAATVAGLDVTGFIAVLPPHIAKWLVILPSGAAVIVHLVEAGIKSLESLERLPLWLLGLLTCLTLPSCITTTTIGPDGKPITTRRLDPEALKIGTTAAKDIAKTVKSREVLPQK